MSEVVLIVVVVVVVAVVIQPWYLLVGLDWIGLVGWLVSQPPQP